MELFNLPASTVINRVIPKNSFDSYATTKQKKLFVDLVDKIRWTNKLSVKTLNLTGKEIVEIQIFEVSLRRKEHIHDLLKLIDKSIPYPIIFVLLYDESVLLSTSQKHAHPQNEDTTVIDWTFSSDWFHQAESTYQLSLKNSLDYIYTDFCRQLSGTVDTNLQLADLVDRERQVNELSREIERLQSLIKKTTQFNRKVEFNIELQRKKEELKRLTKG